MKYRIIERPFSLIDTEVVFYVQKKYKYWPFWLDLLDYGRGYGTLEKAKEVLDTFKSNRNTPDIIHEA